MLIRTTTGLELSEASLRIAVVRTVLGRRRLVENLEIEGFLGMSEDQRRRSLEELVRERKVPVSRVHLVLPPDHGVTRQLELPVEAARQAESVVELQMESLSPWPPSSQAHS